MENSIENRLISPESSSAGVAMSGAGAYLQNKILVQIEAGIDANITPRFREMYLLIVSSVNNMAFGQKTHPRLIEGLKFSPDISKNVSLICTGMVAVIYQESKPDTEVFLPAVVPASITLMCQILQFAEKSHMIELTPDVVAGCALATTNAVLAKFGIDKDKVRQAVDAGKAQQAPSIS